jgi:hypothetical protein
LGNTFLFISSLKISLYLVYFVSKVPNSLIIYTLKTSFEFFLNRYIYYIVTIFIRWTFLTFCYLSVSLRSLIFDLSYSILRTIYSFSISKIENCTFTNRYSIASTLILAISLMIFLIFPLKGLLSILWIVTSFLIITLILKSLVDLALIKFDKAPESINTSILFLLTFITSIYILSNSSDLISVTFYILYNYRGLSLKVLSNLLLRTRGCFPTLLILASILPIT